MKTKSLKKIKKQTSAPKNQRPTDLQDSDPQAREISLRCAQAVIDKKALQTTIINVGAAGSFADYFLVSSGTNERQVQAMADEAVSCLKAQGLMPKVEGYDSGRWVLVDAASVVLHLFHEDIRGFYKLEELWATAPRVAIPQEYFTATPQ